MRRIDFTAPPRVKMARITTTVNSTHSGYRIAVSLNDSPAYDFPATPGQVVAFRNAECEFWTPFADQVEANAIPVIGGGLLPGTTNCEARSGRGRHVL